MAHQWAGVACQWRGGTPVGVACQWGGGTFDEGGGISLGGLRLVFTWLMAGQRVASVLG